MPYRSYRDKRRHDQEYYESVTKPRRQQASAQSDRKIIVTLRLAESVIARCIRIREEALTTGRYPWRTLNEIYRALIVKGLESMKDDPSVEAGLPYLKGLRQIEYIEGPRKEAETLLSKATTELSRMLEIGATDQAVQFYHGIMETIEDIPPTLWRDWLIEQMETTFPNLVNEKVKGVSAWHGNGRLGGQEKRKRTNTRTRTR